MSPPKHDLVVADCDAALALDRNYVKALNRRAGALEQLKRYEEALRDFTAATILDKFQNENAAQAVERVLKRLSTEKAAEILAVRASCLAFVLLFWYTDGEHDRPARPGCHLSHSYLPTLPRSAPVRI